MDTAPKDGTEVLLLVKSKSGLTRKVVAHYMRGGHCIEDHPPIAEGWYYWNGSAFDTKDEPVRWTLMPPDPVDL